MYLPYKNFKFMDIFPKKYNNKNLIKNQKIEKNWIDLYSPSIPLDQKINPWSVFCMYFKDMYCKIHSLMSEPLQNINWYTVSSIYHSSLDTTKNNVSKIQLPWQIKKNLSFIEGLGLTTNSSSKNFAMTEKFNIYMRKVFSKLFSSKKLNKLKSIIHWSKMCQKGVNDVSIKEKDVQRFTIKYFIEAKWQTINIVTTRIETIFADVAIAVNPTDKRYKKLIWQNVIIPIVNRSIPIIADESVDVFQWEWAIRVTPWHDAYWLELAKKHWLPTDIFAVNIDWKFTEYAWEFAWKDLSEFYDNIVKYVDDIWNMEKQVAIKEDRFFDKNTWEELFPMALDQWELEYDYSKDSFFNFMQWKNLEFAICEKIESKTKLNISNRSWKGLFIPVVSNSDTCIPIDDDTILDAYENKKSKKDILMTLIIINLILNNDLKQTFTLEELIDVLFSRNFIWDNTKIQEYLDIYTNKWEERQSYKCWLKSIKRFLEYIDKDSEKIMILTDILKESFWVQMDDNNISINYHDFFWVAWLELQTRDCFNKNFIDYCRIMYNLWCEYSEKSYAEISPENRYFLITKEEIDSFIEINLLALQYSKRQIFSDFKLHPSLVDEKGVIISNYNSKFLSKDFYENFNKYWIDSIRLSTLFSYAKDDNQDRLIFNTFTTNNYNLLLSKIRNANRYIFTKYKEKYGNNPIIIKNILNSINENSISDYDNRILHNLKIIIDDYNYQISEKKYLTLWRKLLENYISEFCDKYINITKVLKKEETCDIILFVGLVYLELLYPYIPNFVTDIKNKFNVEWDDISVLWLNNINLSEKNYKINIFTDLLDKITLMKNKLGMQRHEIVDIFIQANPDFLQFLKENEHIFRLLTKIQTIDLLRFNDELPSGYEVDNVINISIWIKKPEKIAVEVKWDVLVDLEREYKEKVEHLQHLKSLFSSIYSNAWSEIIEKKRQEILNLQNELEDLEFKIWKLKIK